MKQKITLGFFKALALLPLWMLYLISDFITIVLYYIVGYRKKVVRANLTSSFPDKTLKEIKTIEKGFYRYLGDQIVETIKMLHISDKEMGRRVKVINPEIVNASIGRGHSAVLLMGHYCNWEWVQEISRHFSPEAFQTSIYHPLNHKMWDDFFKILRGRWHNDLLPMNRAPHVLLNRENTPWICGFIADAWTWQKYDNNWIEFLNHKTWFVTGPEVIGKRVGAEFFYLEINRIKRGYYKMTFHPLHPKDDGQTFPHLREFWQEFEKCIERNPAYWLWSHKRWK